MRGIPYLLEVLTAAGLLLGGTLTVATTIIAPRLFPNSRLPAEHIGLGPYLLALSLALVPFAVFRASRLHMTISLSLTNKHLVLRDVKFERCLGGPLAWGIYWMASAITLIQLWPFGLFWYASIGLFYLASGTLVVGVLKVLR